MAPTDPFVIPGVCVSLQADKKKLKRKKKIDKGGSGQHTTTGLMIQEIKDDNDEGEKSIMSVDLLMTKYSKCGLSW